MSRIFEESVIIIQLCSWLRVFAFAGFCNHIFQWYMNSPLVLSQFLRLEPMCEVIGVQLYNLDFPVRYLQIELCFNWWRGSFCLQFELGSWPDGLTSFNCKISMLCVWVVIKVPLLWAIACFPECSVNFHQKAKAGSLHISKIKAQGISQPITFRSNYTHT